MRKGRPKSQSIKVGDVFKSKSYGDFVVVRVENAKEIECEFIATGWRVVKQAEHIRSGSVKDPFYPSILGVGYLGAVSREKGDEGIYQRWRNMLTRCYDDEYQRKNPSYIGCKVDPVWHNFQNFKSWFIDKSCGIAGEFHLDKDGIREGNKTYSPDLCQLISPAKNNELACCRAVSLLSPFGNIHDVINVSKFCRENGLSQAHMSAVINGKRKHHKGWKRA